MQAASERKKGHVHDFGFFSTVRLTQRWRNTTLLTPHVPVASAVAWEEKTKPRHPFHHSSYHRALLLFRHIYQRERDPFTCSCSFKTIVVSPTHSSCSSICSCVTSNSSNAACATFFSRNFFLFMGSFLPHVFSGIPAPHQFSTHHLTYL